MPFCSIMTCKNDSRNVNLTHGGITYHIFPKDPELRETWREATGRINWKPKKGSSICSIHFDEKYFMLKDKRRKRLCSYAIPTLKVLSFHTEMQIVTFEKLNEPLNQPDLTNILNGQGLTSENVSLMVPVKPPEDDGDDDNDDDDDDDEGGGEDNKILTSRERKLKAKLRWTRSEINKQKRIIKNYEMQIYRMKVKSQKTKELLDLLSDKFAMPIQEIVKIDLNLTH